MEIANKVGASEVVSRIVDELKDQQETYRQVGVWCIVGSESSFHLRVTDFDVGALPCWVVQMVMEAIQKTLANLGASDISPRLEEQLIDGILYAYQGQSDDSKIILDGFGQVVNALGMRVKPYFPQIMATIKWRFNNNVRIVFLFFWLPFIYIPARKKHIVLNLVNPLLGVLGSAES